MPNKNEESKQERVSIQFADKQLFNRRKITKDGNEISLISVSLPSTAEHKGFYVDVNEKYVNKSKFSDKMSFTSFKKDSTIPIYKYDKETGEKEKVELTADELKAEFNSWKKKENSNEKNNDSVDADEKVSDRDFEEIDV